MNDLERELRGLLEREAGDAPAPHETPAAVRRTRRRQVRTVAVASLGVASAVAVAVAGLRLFGGEPDRLLPASTTDTMNGVTITFPETWVLTDPDEAGLNGPEPAEQLPRLILVLTPTEPAAALGCPGLAQAPGAPPTFVMTIQETPLVLAGGGPGPWPVELEPFDVGESESACYPGWTFSQATWTAAGRSFDARVGIAPEASEAEREALLAAFASMTFEPVAEGSTSVVLATGTAGGEEWSLTATRDGDELVLGLEGETFASGAGGFDPSADELLLSSQEFGEGAQAERVVFAAVPADVVLIAGVGPTFTVYPDVLDVPEEIDARLNAFVATIDVDTAIAFEGFNATDDLVVSGGLDAGGRPLETALPEPDEVLFDGRTNDCWWTLTRTSEGSGAERVQLRSPLGHLLTEILADVGPDAPPIQLMSYTCPIGQGGTLVFGLVTEEVAHLRWPSSPVEGYGLPECRPAADFPAGFCNFLVDGVGDSGEAIAVDADGNEIGRASFG